MFEWLDEELARIKTPGFHVLDPAPIDRLVDVERTIGQELPSAYKTFVSRFGHARLYRTGPLYHVEVFASPEVAVSESGEPLVRFGRTDHSVAYFGVHRQDEGPQVPIVEWYGPGKLRRSADDFESWLKSRCRAARRRYNAEEWRRLEAGPAPFTEEEASRVAARRKFRWTVDGIDPDGQIRFRVHNGSARTLPFLTIGARSSQGDLEGRIWLPVRDLAPGETAIIRRHCYQKQAEPSSMSFFDVPDPRPENRDRYWEFRSDDPPQD